MKDIEKVSQFDGKNKNKTKNNRRVVLHVARREKGKVQGRVYNHEYLNARLTVNNRHYELDHF